MSPGDAPSCDAVSEELAELALGVLTGEERARVLAHLDGCDRCSAELSALIAVADRLTMDTPEADPPVGFELEVLRRIQAEPPRRAAHGWSRAVMAAAAVTLALVAAFAMGHATRAPGRGTHPHAEPPALENGLRTAELTAAGKDMGQVYAYSGPSRWLLMTVNDLPAGSSVVCEVTTMSGTTMRLGTFWLASGDGSWATDLPVAAWSLRSAQVATSGGVVLARARFTAA